MVYKMKTVPHILIMTGLIAVLIMALVFAGIIIIAPNTSVIGTGELAGMATVMLYFIGGLITFCLFVVALTFLPAHMSYHKNRRDGGYLWLLFVLSVIAVILSAKILVNMLILMNQQPISDFAKLTIAALSCGALPFCLIICGCVVNIVQKIVLFFQKLTKSA